MQFRYKAPPTVAKFLKDDAGMRVIMGPQGSGKSSGSVIETLRRSITRRPDGDGFRRAKWVIVRNTIPMLRDTTIPTFLRWFPHGTLGTWHATDKEYHFRFGDVRAQVLFRALDDRDDVAKLLSSEYTGAYFNEFREIDPVIYEAMTKRVGRWVTDPNWTKEDIDAAWYGIWADTNPPQVGSWHYQMMEKEVANNWSIFKQPSGRSPEAENTDHLRSDYYSTDGLSEEYIRVMIDGEYGYDQSGLPVLGKVFQPSWHVQAEHVRLVQSAEYPLLIGLDAGLQPAAVLGQRDYKQRLLTVGECFTARQETMGMERFLQTRLIPYLRTNFPNAKPIVVADPAIAHRAQANEVTSFDIISKYFTVHLAASDKTEPRVSAAEMWLTGAVDKGKPKVLMDDRTPHLQGALAHGYRFEKKKATAGFEADVKNKPLKDWWSNVADAFMYLCMYAGGANIVAPQRARDVVVESSRGWT